MTEKRFTMCHEQNDINGWAMSIVDWQTKEPFDYTTYEVHSANITDTKEEMEDLCDLLNEQHETIHQLKIKNENLIKISAMTQVKNDKLKEENEQLKKEILWWKYRCGEDISGDV